MANQGIQKRAFTAVAYHRFWECLDLLFPSRCAGCNELGYRWCSQCDEDIKPIQGTICFRCGEPLADLPSTGSCHCASFLSNIDQVRSYAKYEAPLSTAIHKLKYRRDIGIAESLAKYLVKLYNSIDVEADMIVSVPLNKKRYQERGYNQALLLARPFSYEIDHPMRPNALIRKQNTRSQVGLNRFERSANVQDAFIADKKFVKDKVILLIDDVSTTGSTMDACAKALKKEGAKYIVGLTLARAFKTKNGYSDLISIEEFTQT